MMSKAFATRLLAAAAGLVGLLGRDDLADLVMATFFCCGCLGSGIGAGEDLGAATGAGAVFTGVGAGDFPFAAAGLFGGIIMFIKFRGMHWNLRPSTTPITCFSELKT